MPELFSRVIDFEGQLVTVLVCGRFASSVELFCNIYIMYDRCITLDESRKVHRLEFLLLALEKVHASVVMPV